MSRDTGVNADTELARIDYEQATESHLKHVRDLDVAMFGEEGAAQRPLLIDIKAELLKRIEFYKAWASEPHSPHSPPCLTDENGNPNGRIDPQFLNPRSG